MMAATSFVSPRSEVDLPRRSSDSSGGRLRRCPSGLSLVLSTAPSPALSRCNSEPGSPRSEGLPLYAGMSEDDLLLSLVRARLSHVTTREDEPPSDTDPCMREPPVVAMAAPAATAAAPPLGQRVEKRRASEAFDDDPTFANIPRVVFRRRGAISLTEACEHMRLATERANKRVKLF